MVSLSNGTVYLISCNKNRLPRHTRTGSWRSPSPSVKKQKLDESKSTS